MLTVHKDLRACRSATSVRLPSHRDLIYREGSRQLQVRYDSPRLADHLKAHVTLTEANRALIERAACFFRATSHPRAECSDRGRVTRICPHRRPVREPLESPRDLQQRRTLYPSSGPAAALPPRSAARLNAA